MALVKCPRCDLNYILDGGTLCTVCRKEVKGEHDAVDTLEMCSECGENPAVPGQELCAYCLKELARRSAVSTDDAIETETASIEIDSVADMDEIELDLHSGLDGEVFDDEDADFGEDEDEESEEEEQ